MWPFDFYNVLLGLVREELCAADVDFELSTWNTSMDESEHFSEILKEKIMFAIQVIKDWQQKGVFVDESMRILHKTFNPNNEDALENMPPEEMMLRNFIGLGILHHWTAETNELSSYKEKIEELKKLLSTDVRTNIEEKIQDDKIERLAARFEN